MRWTNTFASITLEGPVSTPVILTGKKWVISNTLENDLRFSSPRFKSLFKIQLDCSNAQRWDGPIHLRQSLLKAASFEKQLRLLMSRRVRAYIIRLDKVTAHHTAELSLAIFVSLQKETFTIQKIKCRKKCCALFCCPNNNDGSYRVLWCYGQIIYYYLGILSSTGSYYCRWSLSNYPRP